MAIPLYLAMTAAEFRNCTQLPPHPAWMACHFSPYGTGLTNLPGDLPKGSLLILNDRTPVHGHDPTLIALTLKELVHKWNCSGLLLDFQRPGCKQTEVIVQELAGLDFPVAVSEPYAACSEGSVFLSTPPLRKPLEGYLAPWRGREIWLEAGLVGEIATVTETGTAFAPLPPGEKPDCPHKDDALFCHYRADTFSQEITFTMQRTQEDLDQLLCYGEELGIRQAVGLYQELGK